MSARAVLYKALCRSVEMPANELAKMLVAALTAAGYRIVGPGELDRETVEVCAEIAEAFAESEQNEALAGVASSVGVGSPGWVKDAMHSNGAAVGENIATALRAIVSQEARDG